TSECWIASGARRPDPASTRSWTSIAAHGTRPAPSSKEHDNELPADPARVPRRADAPDLRPRARALPGGALVRGAGPALLDRVRTTAVHLAPRRGPGGVGRLGDSARRLRQDARRTRGARGADPGERAAAGLLAPVAAPARRDRRGGSACQLPARDRALRDARLDRRGGAR